MQGGAGEGVPVRVLGEPVDVDAVGLPLVLQSEPVGDDDHARPGRFGHFQLDLHRCGLGGDLDHLPVGKSRCLCVLRMHGERAHAELLVPGRVSHDRVGVGVDVPSRHQDERPVSVAFEGFGFRSRSDAPDPLGHLGVCDVDATVFGVNAFEVLVRVHPSDPDSFGLLQQRREDLLAHGGPGCESNPSGILLEPLRGGHERPPQNGQVSRPQFPPQGLGQYEGDGLHGLRFRLKMAEHGGGELQAALPGGVVELLGDFRDQAQALGQTGIDLPALQLLSFRFDDGAPNLEEDLRVVPLKRGRGPRLERRANRQNVMGELRGLGHGDLARHQEIELLERPLVFRGIGVGSKRIGVRAEHGPQTLGVVGQYLLRHDVGRIDAVDGREAGCQRLPGLLVFLPGPPGPSSR